MADLGGMLAITTGTILLTLSSLGLVALARLKGVVENTLAFAIIAYATLVLLAQILSELSLVHWAGFLSGHALIALLVVPFSLKLYPAQLAAWRNNWPGFKHGWRQSLTAQPVLLLLGLFVSIFMLVGLFLLLIVPPNTYDSLWYHLTRVAYWLHNGTLHHFRTPDLIKTAHQGYNGEIGLLWLTALWGTDRLTALVQWLLVIFSIIAIYGIGRQLRFSGPASLFAALIWATFTIVVVQSTSTKNDISVAFFVTAAFYFLLAGLRDASQPQQVNLSLFGLSLGLAVGVKPMALMIGPGLAVLAGLLLLNNSGQYLPKLIYAGLWGIVGLVLLGSYNYALNWLEYRSFFGPAEVSAKHLIESPSAISLVSNLGRMGYHFFDPDGLPVPLVETIEPWRSAAGQTAFALLHLPTNPPGANFEEYVFDFDRPEPITPRDEGAWYGPLGFLLFLPALFYYLVVSPKEIWRWSTAFMAFSYIIVFAVFVRWQPWMGRMLLIAVTLGAPLLAGFYAWSEKYKVLRWGIALVAVIVLSWTATHNYHRPLLGQRTIWNLDYYSLRTFRKPQRAPLYRYIDAVIPADARLGVAGSLIEMQWTYPFFGPQLKRTVVELGTVPPRIEADLFTKNEIDYLVFPSNTPENIDSGGPFWPLVGGEDQWFMVKRTDVELFADRAHASDRYRQAFGADYAAYLDLKKILDHEAQPVRVLSTDPRMPYYDLDKRFAFNIPDDLGSLKDFTHLVLAPGWSAADYERLGVPFADVQSFLAQAKFVKKIAEVNGYVLYRLLF